MTQCKTSSQKWRVVCTSQCYHLGPPAYPEGSPITKLAGMSLQHEIHRQIKCPVPARSTDRSSVQFLSDPQTDQVSSSCQIHRPIKFPVPLRVTDISSLQFLSVPQTDQVSSSCQFHSVTVLGMCVMLMRNVVISTDQGWCYSARYMCGITVDCSGLY